MRTITRKMFEYLSLNYKLHFSQKNSKLNTRPNLTLFRESSFVIAHFKFVSFPVPFPHKSDNKTNNFSPLFYAAKANIQQMLHTYTPAH